MDRSAGQADPRDRRLVGDRRGRPQLSADLFGTTSPIVCGLAFVVLATCAAVTQLVFGHIVPWLGATAGSVTLAAGMLLIVLSATTSSTVLLLAGAVIAGGGFGVAFLGVLRALSAAIAPGQRAEVMAAFSLVAYTALSVPAILAALAVAPLGIARTYEIVGTVVAVLALVVAFEAWRTRPT